MKIVERHTEPTHKLYHSKLNYMGSKRTFYDLFKDLFLPAFKFNYFHDNPIFTHSLFFHGACTCVVRTESLYLIHSYFQTSRVREQEIATRLSNRLFHVPATLMF